MVVAPPAHAGRAVRAADERRALDGVRRDAIIAGAGGIATLALYACTLAPSITMANGAGDSGELASTAYTLGIAHPTGYPLYTLLGFAVTHSGRGEPAFYLNVFSAAMGAIAAGLLLLLSISVARRARPDAPWPLAAIAGALAVAAFALSADVWTEAVVAETRTLALALDALVLVLLIVPVRRARWHALVAAFVYGLALSDHLLSLYLAPAVAMLLFPWARFDARRWAALLACCLAGLSLYLYLPLRAAAHPAANWGDPDTLTRFLWVVTGQEYRYEMFGLSPTDVVARVSASLAMVWDQLNGATAAAAAIGIVALARRQPALVAALLTTFVIDVVATSNYQASAAPAYLALGFLCVSVCAALGWLVIGQAAVRVLRPLVPRGVAPMALACVAATVTFGLVELPTAVAARQAVALSSTTAVRDHGISVLRSLPRRAVIFAQGDAASVPLWYAQRSLRVRPDVTIVATALLTFSWYYQQVRALPAFDGRLLPASNASSDDGADFTLVQQRTALLAHALVPGRTLYAVMPDPALTTVCRQFPYGSIYDCARPTTQHRWHKT